MPTAARHSLDVRQVAHLYRRRLLLGCTVAKLAVLVVAPSLRSAVTPSGQAVVLTGRDRGDVGQVADLDRL
jgi:hypothetical protein